jgi:hypothetical protein
MEMSGAIILKTAGGRDTLISKTAVGIAFFEDGNEWGQCLTDCIGGSLYFEDDDHMIFFVQFCKYGSYILQCP